MAKVFLNSGESFTLANSAEVYGAAGTGTEKVLLTGAATAITTDQNIERVELSGNISAYTFQVVGNQVKVYAGTTLVTTIGVQGDADGTKVAFGDGSADLKITGLNQATLGGQALSSTAAAAVTGATLNATDKSATAGSGGTLPGVGQTFTLTTTAETKTLTAGANDTVDGSLANSADGDTIVDSSTTDVDTATIKLTTAPTTTPTLTNVEKINLALDYFAPSFDSSKITNGTVTVSTAQEGNTKATFTNVGTNGVKFEVGTGVSTLILGGTTGSADTTAVKLKGGSLALTTNDTNTLETVAIDSAGTAANAVTLTAATTSETFNVTGAQSLTLKTTAAMLNGDTVTNGLATGQTLAVEFSSLAGSNDVSKVATTGNAFSTSTTATAMGNTDVLTFAAGTTSLTVNTADVFTSAAASAGSILKATGTATTDVLNLTLAKDQATIGFDGFETVNLTYTDTTTDLTLASVFGASSVASALTTPVSSFKIVSGRDVTITAGAGKTFDFSGLTGTAKATITTGNTTSNVTVTGGANADTLNLSSLTTGKGTVLAGAGDDTVTGGSAADSIQGGDGNDSINGGAGADTIDGGAGNDIFTDGDAANDVFVGGAGNDSLTISSAAGDDAFLGGDGNDLVTFASGTLNTGFTSADTLVGGAGTDTLTFNAAMVSTAGSAGTIITLNSEVTGWENITVGSGGTISIKTVDANVAAGETLAIDATAISTAVANYFDGSSELDGKFSITFSTTAAAGGGDTIIGGAGNDTIIAGAGADSITGGKGADSITLTEASAGAGADIVNFAVGDSTLSAYDTITGFTTGSVAADKLVLPVAASGGLIAGSTAATINGTDNGAIKAHKVDIAGSGAGASGGDITFYTDDAASGTALTINTTNFTNAINYLSVNYTTAGQTGYFDFDSNNDNANDSAVVFQSHGTGVNMTVVCLAGITSGTATAGLAISAAAGTIWLG